MEQEERFIQRFAAGDVVFTQGSEGCLMYVILDGAVEIRRSEDGSELKSAQLGPGEFFGEMAVVDSEVRTASAIVISDNTQLVAIDQARFVYLTSQQPAFALTVMRVMTKRIRSLQASRYRQQVEVEA